MSLFLVGIVCLVFFVLLTKKTKTKVEETVEETKGIVEDAKHIGEHTTASVKSGCSASWFGFLALVILVVFAMLLVLSIPPPM